MDALHIRWTKTNMNNVFLTNVFFSACPWVKVIPEVDSIMATGGRQTCASVQKNRCFKHPDHIKPQPNITQESKWKSFAIIFFDLMKAFGFILCCDACVCWYITFVTEDFDTKVMAGEILETHESWEPSIRYSLRIERFCFVGHKISIRESFDSYGALIWPGVRADTKQTQA